MHLSFTIIRHSSSGAAAMQCNRLCPFNCAPCWHVRACMRVLTSSLVYICFNPLSSIECARGTLAHPSACAHVCSTQLFFSVLVPRAPCSYHRRRRGYFDSTAHDTVTLFFHHYQSQWSAHGLIGSLAHKVNEMKTQGSQTQQWNRHRCCRTLRIISLSPSPKTINSHFTSFRMHSLYI